MRLLLSSEVAYEHTRVFVDWFSPAQSRNAYSQFGEDGLIAAALEHIGETNRWCFEVGASDGVFFSNTKALRDKDWNAVLIEADDGQYGKLELFANDRVRTVHKRIGSDSLDRILDAAGCPHDLDVGVIDIDGQDYWAWKGMQKFRPRLMLVEYARDHDESGQAKLEPILQLGTEKGYVALATTYVNVLFCRGDLAA